MPNPTQANRKIAINTPLGTDVLVVRRCSIREQLSRLFEIELELSSTRNDINFDEIIGKNVTLRLEVAKQQTRYFNGFINRFTQGKSEKSYSTYRATVVPWLWFLTRSSDCRIFQASMEEAPDAMTVPGIIKKVFKDHGFEDFRDDGLSGSYREWDFCVQYRETAFNFVSRLMELEGISYFFEHSNGKHILVLADSANANVEFPDYATVSYNPHVQGGNDREAITDWVTQKEVQPGSVAVNDFNFENPRLAQQKGLVSNSEIGKPHDLSSFEMYEYPGTHLTSGDGDTLARLRIEELHTRHEILHGNATVRGLSAGYKFQMQGHPRGDQNREYLVTSVDYQIDAGAFETGPTGTAIMAGAPPAGGAGTSASKPVNCNFSAVPAEQPFRPARTTPKPHIRGPQTAIVVGPDGDETHTDKFGRVKVQFHWDRYGKQDENASCWIRVSQAWAGKNWGAFALPRIGNEVIVEFLEGDPDRPIVTGQVYNGDMMPPYELPANATMTTLKSNSSVGGEGFNELRFEDKKDSEKIFFHAQKDLDLRVKNDRVETIAHDRHLIVENDKKEWIKNERHEKVDQKHVERIGGDRHLSVGGEEAIEITGKHSLTVKDDVVEVFKKNHSEAVTENLYFKAKNTVIEAEENITIHVGNSYIAIDANGIKIATDGKIELDAKDDITQKTVKNFTAEATSNMSLKGTAGLKAESPAPAEVSSSAILTLKGSLVKIN